MAESSSTLEPVNILLVDDKPNNLIALESLLSQPEYNLVTATSGAEALACLNKRDFAVILTDVMMPIMDGFEFATQVRKNERLREIPIIFLTAMASDLKDVYRGYSVGAVDYLQKPLEPEVVKAKVAVFVQLFRHECRIRFQAEELLERERRVQEYKVRELSRKAESQRRRIKNALRENVRKQRIEDLQALQLEVTQILSEPLSINEILPKVLETISMQLGSKWAALWITDEVSGKLKPAYLWYTPTDKMNDFALACSQIELTQAQDILGQVWDGGKPLWISKHAASPDSPRFEALSSLDPHGLVALPLPIWEGSGISGVAEFFSENLGPEDKLLIETLVAICTRISWYVQRKKAEQILRDSEEKYRQLVTGIQDYAIFIISPSGIITTWNEGAKCLYGYDTDEIVGKHFSCLFAKAAIEKGHPQIELELARGKGRHEREGLRVRKDRSEFLANSVLTALRDNSNVLWGFAKTSYDISIRRQAEDDLRQAYDVVNAEVKERTAALEASNAALSMEVSERQRIESLLLKKQEELQEAMEMAKAASAAKTAFLANMSHEIRTPLGAVMGFSELLLMQNQSNSEKKNCVEAIKRNSEILLGVINDILDLSKVEAGKLEIEKSDVALENILTDIRLPLDLNAKEKGLKTSISSDGVLPVIINTDPIRLCQILGNIVGNAIKFTESGSICITIKKLLTKDGKAKLGFIIKDTGLGISEEQTRQLFKAFSQADSSITRKFGGTGLGLALSKKLAKALGGDVEISQSTLGEGSTFTVTIDPGDAAWVTTQVIKSKFNSEPEIETEIETPNLRGLRVLLVDDAPENQLIYTYMLETAGIIVETASNGREGLEKAITGNFAVILMDLQMPDMDGYTATIELRKREYKKPIIALTAHAMTDERQRCLASGFNGHLSKPTKRKTLLQCINEHSDKRTVELSENGTKEYQKKAKHLEMSLPNVKIEHNKRNR
jgi:PAS domain S-box-containing protein